VFVGDTLAVAQSFSEELANPQKAETSGSLHQLVGRKIALRRIEFLRKEARALIRIRQIDADLRDVRIAKQLGVQFVCGFGEEHHADIEPAHVIGSRPFQQCDERRPFLDTARLDRKQG
jgi:hypothetical protein